MAMSEFKPMDLYRAAQDLKRHTLSGMPRALDRLIYLASTRDYNSGFYYHDGLANRFDSEIACQALAELHYEAFQELVATPLKALVEQMDAYIVSTHTTREEFIASWSKLEPFRVAIPVDSDPVLAEFLFSNLRVALAILELHPNTPPDLKPNALPPQLLAL